MPEPDDAAALTAADSPARPLYTAAFAWMAASHLLLAIPMLSQFPVLAWWMNGIGGSKVAIGQLMSAAILGGLAARPFAGPLLDHHGRRPVIVGAGLVSALGFIAYDRFDAPGWPLLALRFAHGVGMGSLFPALYAHVADISPPARRTEGLAVYGAVGLFGMTIGPSLGVELAKATSFAAWGQAAGASILAGVAIAAACPVAYRRAAGARPRIVAGLVEAYRTPGLHGVWAATLLWGIVLGSCLTFVEPLVRERGLGFVRDFYVPYGAVAVIMRLGGGRLLDRLRPASILLPALAVQAVGLVALMRADSVAWLRVAGVLCGIGHGYAFPILNALAVARSRPDRVGTAVIAFTIAIDLGQFLFNPLGGWIAERHGFVALFATALAIQLAAGLAFAQGERRIAQAGPTAP